MPADKFSSSRPAVNEGCADCGYPRRSAEGLCPACLLAGALDRGAMNEEKAEAEEMGRWCGEYELLEQIGRGGMGVVWRARRRGLDREVALKWLSRPAGLAAEEVRRFRQEAQLLARLSHPHIVTVHDVGEAGEGLFFVMSLAEGGSLARRLADEPTAFSSAAAAGLVVAIARALEIAHGHGVLHRDLKPANILLTADDAPLLADFGLACWHHGPQGLTLTGSALGTPAYMAPEQALGGIATTASARFCIIC